VAGYGPLTVLIIKDQDSELWRGPWIPPRRPIKPSLFTTFDAGRCNPLPQLEKRVVACHLSWGRGKVILCRSLGEGILRSSVGAKKKMYPRDSAARPKAAQASEASLVVLVTVHYKGAGWVALSLHPQPKSVSSTGAIVDVVYTKFTSKCVRSFFRVSATCGPGGMSDPEPHKKRMLQLVGRSLKLGVKASVGKGKCFLGRSR